MAIANTNHRPKKIGEHLVRVAKELQMPNTKYKAKVKFV
jgi:hypothetical protein